ncbi:unnamed protein product [Camellia sinensis]
METKSESTRRTQPVALFMAFGTKGDVYPISAIAAAFAFDQEQYRVVLVTHSAHKNLSSHLAAKNVEYLPVSSPPVLSPYEDDGPAGTVKLSFSLQKRRITKEHRLECISNVEQIFGGGPSLEEEGWNLAELFHVRCIVAAPYVVPYSAPSSFERYFREELPPLYEYLQEAPIDKVGWKDVIHWMWPLFTEDWGSWRSDEIHKEVVECPGYWPSNVRVCGFWFLPLEWQFSCNKCAGISALISSEHLNTKDENVMCSAHAELQSFLKTPASLPPVFIGFSSVGSMGFLRNPQAFLEVLRTIVDITSHRFILFSAGFEPLDAAIQKIADDASSSSEQRQFSEDGISIFGGRLFCFSGCAAAVHHGGSGSTAAALHAGIPQVVCPFMLDQFYWAERMFWLGVSSEPLKTNHLLPDESDDTCVREAANMLTGALNYALSSKVKARASEIAERLSLEDGVLEALKILKEEISCSNTTRH